MYLSFLVSLLFMMYDASATECLVAKDVDVYKTKTIKVDDVVFHLHFPEDRPWFTQKVIDTLLTDIPKANHYFHSKPQTDVHLVTNSASSANGFDSNGMATVFPYNIIYLNEYPPTGKSYLRGTDEWVRNLVLHEYIHILTMDMTNGWIDRFRSIFGSVVKTNGILPRWLIEGSAVWYESTIPGQGRLNQKGVKYQVYKALTDKDFCRGISCLDVPLKYPYGHAPYWIGGEFVKYLEELNPGFVRCIYTENSYSFPFFLNKIFKACIDMSVKEAYKSFKDFYIQSHRYLNSYCPFKKSACKALKKQQVDETQVDFQSGFCEKGDYLVYLKRDELGRNRLNIPHKIELLNTKNGFHSTFKSNYPVSSLMMVKNKCIIKQSQYNGCRSSNIFTELKIPSLQADIVNESYALGIEIDNQNNIVEVHYQDGRWDYQTGDKVVKTLYGQTRPEFNTENLSKSRKNKEIESVPYSGSDYLSPKYFMFNYSNFANLSAINLNTSLLDPLKSQNASISLTDYLYRADTNLLGGNLYYSYKNNDWLLSAMGFRSYYINSFTAAISSSELFGFSYKNFYDSGKWNFSNRYGFQAGKKDDFISDRDLRKMSFNFGANKIQNQIYRRERDKSFNLEVSYTQAESNEKEDYLGLFSSFGQSFNQGEKGLYGYKIRHGKYFKDDLKGGFYAAGGVNNFFGSGYTFPLYMLSYADLIGNEITTSSLYYSTRLKNHFRGFGLFPFFMKNSGLSLGAEYAKGKYFFTADKIYKNDYLSGFYIKYYLNTRLAYIWDATISIAFSQMQYPIKMNRLLLLFDAASF